MKDILELIPSQTMREYLKEIGHTFTDSERATIIYNLYLPFPKRDELLLKIATTTQDEKLRLQIKRGRSGIFRTDPETCGSGDSAGMSGLY